MYLFLLFSYNLNHFFKYLFHIQLIQTSHCELNDENSLLTHSLPADSAVAKVIVL